MLTILYINQGDVSVFMNNFRFDQQRNFTNWSNMQAYSYHTYGKFGHNMNGDLQYLYTSLNNPTIAPIITEHNSKTSASWNLIATTPDTASEAALLASQIMSVVYGGISQFYTFKFSVTPSSNAGQQVAKNGLRE
jgi:hypothetical protein